MSQRGGGGGNVLRVNCRPAVTIAQFHAAFVGTVGDGVNVVPGAVARAIEVDPRDEAVPGLRIELHPAVAFAQHLAQLGRVRMELHGGQRVEIALEASDAHVLPQRDVGGTEDTGVLPEEVYRYQYFRNLWRFEEAPSLSAMVWFDRKVMDLENIATGIGTVFNWFADLTQVVPEAFPQEGSVLELVITPCGHLLPLSDERIMEMVIADIRKLLPGARDAEVLKSRLVRERQGIFAQRPHMDRYRPTQRTPLDNLYLCGDFTMAGHSAGMEGAVVSGKLATSAILLDKMGIVEDYVEHPHFSTGLIPFIKYGQPALLALAALGFPKLFDV